MDPGYAETLVDGVFKKRRPGHRPSSDGQTTSRKKRRRDRTSNSQMKIRCGIGQSTPLVLTNTNNTCSVNEVNLSRESTLRVDNCLIRDSVANVQETPPSSAESYSTVLDVSEKLQLFLLLTNFFLL